MTVSFPALKDLSLGLSYGMYAVFAFLSLFFVFRWVRETKATELEDMTEEAHQRAPKKQPGRRRAQPGPRVPKR